MRTSRPARLTVAIATLVLMILSTSPSHASSKDLTFGVNQQPRSVLNNRACVISTRIWAQELGKSGVTRLKAQFKLHAPYVQSYYPFPTYHTTNWLRTSRFPNDAQNYAQYFSVNIRQPPGGRYALWTRVVGERPSLFLQDRAISHRLGDVGCEGGVGHS